MGIVAAPNFSTGVVLFEAIVAHAAKLFASAEDFGAFLHEAHHAAKKDAPSGTALLLKRSMEQAGFTRPIDVSSTRAGFIPGTHTVGFDGPAESITLTHAARDRVRVRARRADGGAVGAGQARLVHDAATCWGSREVESRQSESRVRLRIVDDVAVELTSTRLSTTGDHHENPFTGVGTALVTPFTKTGDLDEAAVRRLGRRQIDGGIHFLVPCGTTGETPTLTPTERLRIVEILVDEAHGQVPVLAGAGGYDTKEVIHLAREMREAGRSGLLSVTPYYNKPTQEGLYQHYRAIAESTPLPIIVYNVPGRTGVNVELATLARLAEMPNIVGVKEASGQHDADVRGVPAPCRPTSSCCRATMR